VDHLGGSALLFKAGGKRRPFPYKTDAEVNMLMKTTTRWICRMGIRDWRVAALCAVFVMGAASEVYAQNQPVYPRGILVLYKNTIAPLRYAGSGSNRYRANINFDREPIQFVVLIKGSDGRFYYSRRTQFRVSDGWIVCAADGAAPYFSWDEFRRTDVIETRGWSGTDVTIEWYRLERTEVDREITKTTRQSPYPPGREIGGETFIRYYLAHIRREGRGWDQTITLPTGGIIAPIVRVRWRERVNNQIEEKSLWAPKTINHVPLPGMNDCINPTRSGCQGSQSTPSWNETYCQYYSGARFPNAPLPTSWIYRRQFSHFLPLPDFRGSTFPYQYPVFVFKNIGSLQGGGGNSMQGLSSNSPPYFIPYDSPAWWRVHIATCYEGVPYEWGGKYYAAETSGVRYSRNRQGTGTVLGFGLDCSGLIAVANGLAGDPNYGTSRIAQLTRQIDWSEVRPGDVLLRSDHVMLVTRVSGHSYNRRVYYTYHYIESVGAGENSSMGELRSSLERVRYGGAGKSELLGDPNRRDDDFVPRRFRGE
jgi:hypothetical protein